MILKLLPVLAGLLLHAAALAAPRPVDPVALAAYVDGVVADRMARDHVAGVTVSVVQGGKVILAKGYGLAGLAPAVPVDPARTLFRIGSIGKTMTAILLMQQVEAGRVDLKQPANTYLAAAQQVPTDGWTRPVRVQDLVAHSAGFEDIAFGHLFAPTAERVLPLGEYLATHRPRRVREPGHGSYSNYGAALGGYLALRVSGAADYPTLIEQRLFRPAGMSATAREPYPARAGLPAPMAAADTARRSGEFRWNGHGYDRLSPEFITNVMPAGGMYATGTDMARYMLLLLGNGTIDGLRVFGDVAATAFRTPVLPVAPGGNGWNHSFVTEVTRGGVVTRSHNGATLNFTSNMFLVPDEDFGIFINGNTESSGGLTAALPELVIDRFFGSPAPPMRPGNPAAVAAAIGAIEGAYVHSRRAYSGLEGFVGLLTSTGDISVNSAGYIDAFGGTYLPTANRDRFIAADGPGGFLVERGAGGAAVNIVPDHQSVLWSRAAFWQRSDLFIGAAVAAMLAALLTLLRPIYATATPAASRPERLSGWGAYATSAAFVAAVGLVALWGVQAEQPETVAFDFPGSLLGPAAGLATLGCVLTLGLLALLWPVWRGGGWSRRRRIGHSLAVLAWLAFAGLLAARGILPPWS